MLMNLRKRMTNQKGFTLIELMVVIAIIGILAAIAIPRMSTATDSAKIAKIQADLRTLGGAISIYNAQVGTDPTAANLLVTSGQINAIPAPPTNAAGATAYTFETATTTVVANPNANPPVAGVTGHPARFTYSFGGNTYYSDGTAMTTP